MKKSLLILSLFVASMILSADLFAQKMPGLDKSPADISYLKPSRNEAPVARVIYSRPQKNDREIFGSLIPYDKVWRTGANEAPEITLYKSVTINGTKIEAGTYALFTIPGKNTWTIIFNSDLHQWGSYGYKKDNDVARVTADASEYDDTIEAFTITFDGSDMLIGWDNTLVRVPMEY